MVGQSLPLSSGSCVCQRRRPVRALKCNVVGPVCESGDFFCHDRRLPRVTEGEYLALMSAGAYGFVMGSNYNTRTLAPEVLVQGSRAALVRACQPVPDICGSERIAPWLR